MGANTIEIKNKLDKLDELNAHLQALNSAELEAIDMVITPEINAKLTEIHEEFLTHKNPIQKEITTLTEEVKGDVVKIGTTVKGSNLMAVWSKGREGGWDSAKLKGFAIAHPEIMAAKKPDGEPIVSIRKI